VRIRSTMCSGGQAGSVFIGLIRVIQPYFQVIEHVIKPYFSFMSKARGSSPEKGMVRSPSVVEKITGASG